LAAANPVFVRIGRPAKACQRWTEGENGGKDVPMEKIEMMKKITEKVGREKAIDLVTQAYNTELLTTMLNRMEDGRSKMIGGYKRRDQLEDALRRVLEVCDLIV
jgi:hypothetical protein